MLDDFADDFADAIRRRAAVPESASSQLACEAAQEADALAGP